MVLNPGVAWLLKPNKFNRGIGIHIFNNLDTFEALIKDYRNL
jgi:hypothetical protein